MPLISVIIPAYNAENTINRLLDNVLNQTLEDIEIILVDDGSLDNTSKIIKSVKDERIKYIYQDNSGAGVARNKGIALAQGEYISFIDADDMYASKNTLELLYQNAKEHHVNICGGSVQGTSNDEKYQFNESKIIEFIDYQNNFIFPRYIYNREFLISHSIKFPKYRVYEDPVFLLKAMVNAKQFYALKDIVYVYTGSHQCESMNIEKVKDYIRGITDEFQFSALYNLSKIHKKTFINMETHLTYYVGKVLDEGDTELLSLLLHVNYSINRDVLASEGIIISDDYIIPPILDVWNAGVKYYRLRNNKFVNLIRKVL